MSTTIFVQRAGVRTLICVSLLGAVTAAGCASSMTKTVTAPSTAAVSPSTNEASRSSSPSSATPAPSSSTTSSPAPVRPQVFHGTGQQDLGTISVPSDTTISWNCPSCGNANFIINNAKSDDNDIPTNGLDQTQGVDPLGTGVYHTVVVNTEAGPWTVAIGLPTAPAPSGSPSASSADGSGSPVSPASDQASGGGSTQCDSNISVIGGECRFAENTFYEYWRSQDAGTLSVYSPADQTSYPVACNDAGSEIQCTATDQGAVVSFSRSSVGAYTQSEASSYADSHNVGP
jgi:hypothetical protein